jgi:RNA polymerase sigma-70 factor (ECF subfamily)
VEERALEQDDEIGAQLRRVAAGDRAAFSALVEAQWAPLFRFIDGVARDAAAAEDALQEAFIAVWRSAGTYRGESSGRTWLYTVARNALHRRHRRRADRPGASEPLDTLEELGAAAGWGDPSSEDRVLSALDDRERVHRALAHLSPDDREVLVLLDMEELSAKEAAETLAIGVAALKSRLHRARLRLVAELGKEERDGG